jgi:hypothetical protein
MCTSLATRRRDWHTISAARQELIKGDFDIVLLNHDLDEWPSAEIANTLLTACISFAFVTGSDGPFEARYEDTYIVQRSKSV